MTRAAAVLTWDGARLSTRHLPARARKFLGAVTPSPRLAKLLGTDEKLELRICWVPRLSGNAATLCPAFTTPYGRRVSFRLARTVSFGATLGVVYRRVERPR